MTFATPTLPRLTGAALVLWMFTTAHAQTAPTTSTETVSSDTSLEEIVVTGTLIKQRDLNSPVPLSIISPEMLQSTGNVETVQVFRNDPEFGSQTRGSENYLNGAGVQALDLRNLGTARTLTLINGRRMAGFTDAGGVGGVDVGMIPQSLITRIDVERDGAGPTYGSDAVAGVVNFILDDKFRGFNVDSSYGISGHDDGQSWRIGGKLGVGNDKGALVVGADWLGKNIIPGNDRDWLLNGVSSLSSTVVRGSPIGPGGEVLAANGRTILACYPAGGGASAAPNCPFYDTNAAGLYPVTLGDTIRDIGAVGHYNINDSVTFKGQAFYTQRSSDLPIGAYSLNTTATFGPYLGGFNIPATSSNNPYGQPVTVKWLTLQAGNTHQVTDSTQLWTNFGLSGAIANRWNWEVMQTISRDTSYQQYTAYPIASHIRNLFLPASCAADPICNSVGAIGNIQSFFENGGHLTPAQAGYGWYDEVVNTAYEVEESTATLSGPLFKLPGGDLQAAVGAEYRRTSGQQVPDEVTETLDAARAVLLPWDAAYSTKEGYAEVQAPLLANAPFARSLDLDLQARYTSFSAANTNLSDATTYKLGLSYAPTDDIRFRAAYGTSFRAPTPYDLYSGGTVQLGSGTDPCNPGGVRVSNATVNANCIASGAPVGPVPASTTLQIATGGSPSLQPERGKSVMVGTIFTPTFAPNLSMTLDYYHITLNNAIGATNLTQALQTCYADPNFSARANNPSDLCYGYNLRNPDQTLQRIKSYSININHLSTDGLDYTGRYIIRSLGAIPGSLAFDLRMTYLMGFFDSSTVLGQERGTFVSGATGTASWPEWRGNLGLSYRVDQFTFGWITEFVSAMKDQSVVTGAIPATNPLGYVGTPTYTLHDFTARWQADGGAYVMLGINNVLDKDPPFAATYIGTRTYNTLPSTFDVIGRYFFVNAGYKF